MCQICHFNSKTCTIFSYLLAFLTQLSDTQPFIIALYSMRLYVMSLFIPRCINNLSLDDFNRHFFICFFFWIIFSGRSGVTRHQVAQKMSGLTQKRSPMISFCPKDQIREWHHPITAITILKIRIVFRHVIYR